MAADRIGRVVCGTTVYQWSLEFTKMSSAFGVKQTLKRPTVMTAGCLGPHPTLGIVGGVQCDLKLKVGDTQLMVFKEGDRRRTTLSTLQPSTRPPGSPSRHGMQSGSATLARS